MSHPTYSALAFIPLPYTGLSCFSLCLLLPITSEHMLCSDVMIGILQNHLILPCVLRLLGKHLGIWSMKAYGKSMMCLPGIASESNKHHRQSSLPPTRYSLAEMFTESVPLWWASHFPFNGMYTAVCIDKWAPLLVMFSVFCYHYNFKNLHDVELNRNHGKTKQTQINCNFKRRIHAHFSCLSTACFLYSTRTATFFSQCCNKLLP